MGVDLELHVKHPRDSLADSLIPGVFRMTSAALAGGAYPSLSVCQSNAHGPFPPPEVVSPPDPFTAVTGVWRILSMVPMLGSMFSVT